MPASERTLKPVITLLYVNLGISVILAALIFLFKKSVLDYQVQHLVGLGKVTLADAGAARGALESVLWIRPVSVLVISIVYIRLAARLKFCRRSTWIRVLVIGVAGFLGLAYLVATAEFPLWMRIGQVVQGLVLLGLLYTATTKDVRAHFAKNRPQPTEARTR
jgi:hypothetical protein